MLETDPWETLNKWDPTSHHLCVVKGIISTKVRPSIFGRFWEHLKSLFKENSLQKVAEIIAALVKDVSELTPPQELSLNKLQTSILKFNKSHWNRNIDSRITQCIQNKLTPSQNALSSTSQAAPPAKEPSQASLNQTPPSPQKASPPEEDVTEEELEKVRKCGDVQVPFVGELKIAYSQIRPELEKTALEIIDKNFTACRIKGDGHCMFRSITVGLLEKYSDKLDTLSELITRLKSTPLHESLKFREGLLATIDKSLADLKAKKSIQDVMSAEAVQNSWVEFLRILAANKTLALDDEILNGHLTHMVNELNDPVLIERLSKVSKKVEQNRRDFEVPDKEEQAATEMTAIKAELDECKEIILPRYIQAKTDMKSSDPLRTYGTNLELIALSTVLGLNIGVIDSELTVHNKKPSGTLFPESTTFIEAIPVKADLFICHEGAHYNTLFKK